MKYFEQIEAYCSEEMSLPERIAFEQALQSNNTLREEWEAYQEAQSLFDFAATELSEADIIAPVGFAPVETVADELVGPDYGKAFGYIVIALVLMVGMYWYQHQANQDKTETTVVSKPIATTIIKPVETHSINVVTQPTVTVSKNQVETPSKVTIAKATPKKEVVKETPKKKVKPVANPVKKQNKPIAKIIEKPKSKASNNQLIAAAEKSPTVLAEDLVFNESIEKGHVKSYKASKTITLSAGFHAKAGANFTAMVED